MQNEEIERHGAEAKRSASTRRYPDGPCHRNLDRPERHSWQEGEEHWNISILPPDDVRDLLKLRLESMLGLRKAVCGLMNTPKKLWDCLKRSLLNHGLTSCLRRCQTTKSEVWSSCGRLVGVEP